MSSSTCSDSWWHQSPKTPLAFTQDGEVTLNLAAAAQKLEALAAELPMQDEDVASTPSPTADVAPADAGTPWTKEVLTTLSACLGSWAGMKSPSQYL